MHDYKKPEPPEEFPRRMPMDVGEWPEETNDIVKMDSNWPGSLPQEYIKEPMERPMEGRPLEQTTLRKKKK